MGFVFGTCSQEFYRKRKSCGSVEFSIIFFIKSTSEVGTEYNNNPGYTKIMNFHKKLPLFLNIET